MKEKITKEEFRKKFVRTRVYVGDESKAIQEQLFKADIEWETNGKMVIHMDMPFLFINSTYITISNNMEVFRSHWAKEVTADEILSYEIVDCEPKYDFKHFDKVLGQASYDNLWHIDFYERTEKLEDGTVKYRCMCDTYSKIVPYNEETEKLLDIETPLNYGDNRDA